MADLMRLALGHGLGNDFLVLLDEGEPGPVAPALAVALCDRSTGVGADGLVRCTRTAAGASFRLRNADGSPAEISGNGARVVGLACARAGWWADRSQPFVLDTPAGERPLSWQGGDLVVARLQVGMGEVGGGDLAGDGDPGEAAEAGGTAAAPDGRWTRVAVTTGNPHLVALVEGATSLPGREELQAAVDLVEAVRPDGQNHEFVVRGPEVGALTMAVFERGAGWTRACGTGSVAAAYAAHLHGWVGRRATVHNPGGDVVVDLHGERGPGHRLTASLTGPAAFVADLEVPEDVLVHLRGLVGEGVPA